MRLTKDWQTRWNKWGKKVNLKVKVPDAPLESEDLIYIPKELTGKSGLILLGKIFPKLQNWALKEDTTVKNNHELQGWIIVDLTKDAPNLNTTEKQLIDNLRKDEVGMTLNSYIIASQYCKEVKGYYFDEGSTWSRLLESRRDGKVVDADFSPRGRLDVIWYLNADNHRPGLGGRSSVGVLKTLNSETLTSLDSLNFEISEIMINGKVYILKEN